MLLPIIAPLLICCLTQYTESHCVLTPSGFLHCYPKEGLGNADKTEDFKPKLSLYLPEFTLGPPTEAKAKKHKFHLTSLREQASGKDASRGLFGLGKKKNVAYSFKAKSHEELLAWWDALDKVTKASQTKKGSPDPNTTREDAHEGAVANLGLPAQNGHNTIQEEPEHMTASPTDATKNETFSDAPTSPSTPTSPSSPTSPKQTTHQRKFSKASTVLSAGGSSMEEEEAEASRARQAAGGVTNEASLPEYEPAATSSKA